MSRPRQAHRRVLAAQRQLARCVLAFAASASGCFKPDDGREPPLDRIYFPTGLALSADGDRLYVANSDWDLQFNAGSVQAYDAARLRELLPRYCDSDADCTGAGEVCDLEPSVDGAPLGQTGTHWCVDAQTRDVCRGLGVQTAGERVLQPGLCAAVDSRTPDLLLDSVSVGAFATDLIYRENPAGGGRLFVPVRSDATLHWIDVSMGMTGGRELDCGQGTQSECDANHRRGDAAAEAAPSGDELPIEPFGVTASATIDGQAAAVLVTHQTEGSVSLFTNDWGQPERGPELSFILGGLGLRPIHATAIPVPEIARRDRGPGGERSLGYQPGFWIAFRNSPFIQLVRYYDAVDSPDQRPFLVSAFADRLTTTVNSDVRGMAVDDSRRRACEDACGPDDVQCLEDCAGVSLDVYLANRVPGTLVGNGALMIGSTVSRRRAEIGNDRLLVSDLVPVNDGPSRVAVGNILDSRGEPRRRVFVTSFDSRSLTIYDPDSRVIDARVPTGRGPTALAIDDVRALAYVAHFTDSYLGVIDLDARHATFGTMILALGIPTPPRGDDR